MSKTGSVREERELRLALAAQHREIDLDAVDASCLRERARLGLDQLRGEHASTTLELDPLEVTRELLDGVDRPDAFDLYRDPVAGFVAAHEVDAAGLCLTDLGMSSGPDAPGALRQTAPQ